MQNYLAAGQHILQNGVKKGDRTGTGTRSVRKVNLVFDLREGFPLMTTKKVNIRTVIHELLWFLQGRGDNEWLVERGCNIWTPWTTKEDKTVKHEYEPWDRLYWAKINKPEVFTEFHNTGKHFSPDVEAAMDWLTEKGVPTSIDKVVVPAGSLNAPYGPTWRNWKSGQTGRTVDQVQQVVDTLRTNPDSRRIIVNSWDSGAMPDESISPQDNIKNGEFCLTPCHILHEMYTEEMTLQERMDYLKERDMEAWDKIGMATVDEIDALLDELGAPKRWLDMCVLIRSNDWFVGAPFNIPSYAVLLHMYASTVGMAVRILDITSVNAHIYENTIPMFIQQYSRTPRALPKMKVLNKRDKMEDYTIDDFELTGYNPYDFIKAPVAV